MGGFRGVRKKAGRKKAGRKRAGRTPLIRPDVVIVSELLARHRDQTAIPLLDNVLDLGTFDSNYNIL